ncbi:MAG: ABC transporter substrate-binding protein [Treponema sp.]|nr:ABC transporter substrate-binding protein [Treponema sp.]
MKTPQTISCALCLCLLLACARNNNDDPYKDGRIHIAALNGPSMMSLGELYHAENNKADSKYTFTKLAAPDAVVAGLANGTFDAACLPANNAVILFNSGNSEIKVAAIIMTNILCLLQKAGTPAIASIADLSGKTIYLTGQGSTPDMALRYLLEKNNINNVKMEFETEYGTIAAGIRIENSKYDYAILPHPFATVATLGEGAAVEAFNLSREWKKVNPESDIITTVLLVRASYLKNNKAAFEKFLEDYQQSIEFMTDNRNLDAASAYVVDMGIVPTIPLAKAALPKCGLTYIDKTKMKIMLNDFYQVLYSQNPASIGGKLPTEKFFYE